MKYELEQAIATVVKDVFDVEIDVVLTRPDEQFGDFATNVALQITKQVGNNPRSIAERICENLEHSEIKEATIAGPGFINITLTDKALWQLAVQDSQVEKQYENVVIETNNPNPFKAMHIGHTFNAILGDSLANLLELQSHALYRVSYHGDVGAHVGRSMYSILAFIDGEPKKLQSIPVKERNRFMTRMYAAGVKAYKEDPAAAKQIDTLSEQSFILNDPLYKQVYLTCKEWSFNAIAEAVDRLGSKPVEKKYLESQADALGVATVKEHPEVFEHSDGAYVFPGKKYGIFDNVFVSSKGRGLYGARDLGLMQLKHRDFKAQKSIIVTAEEQKDYFRGVIKAAELCLPELKGVTENISTGTVKLSTGKMSSRTGDILDINWLFGVVADALKTRGGEATDQAIASALRYQFLRVKIGKDVVFDPEEAVSLQGNSGPYLQYAHARAHSILEKAGKKNPTPLEDGVFNKNERLLIRKLGEYNEILQLAVNELAPHHLCNYLYELAQEFNRFYEKNKVIGDVRESQRIEIVARYTDILQTGLHLLGIHAPKKM